MQRHNGRELTELRPSSRTGKHNPLKILRPVVSHPTNPGLAIVPLTNDRFAVIDAIDAAAVGRFNWQAVTAGTSIYAVHRIHANDGKTLTRRMESLHRFIGAEMGLSLTEFVDHKNGDGLDCRRHNLRDATPAQNSANMKIGAANRSGVKGVRWVPGIKKWSARVKLHGKAISCGAFESIEDAAAAVAAMRVRVHGEFANHGTTKDLPS